ncbi:aminotransferase-like domain-containing protein [Niallia sp. 01092]|uniref:aminotransferase-like domain-containing protein n=1 Tax=unclassified Niallia TaxID=2837522 RepID=UPI003FD5449B
MGYQYAKRMDKVQPSAIRELLKLGADPDVISFGGGYPDPTLFPIDKLRNVFDMVLLEEGQQALQYTTSEGHLELRRKLVKRMEKVGVSCDLDNLFMINGGQQGLDLVAKMFIDRGDIIITEEPTFLGALVAFNPYEPEYLGVSMDEEGMDMDHLEQLLKANPSAKMIYTVPEFQNPTGVTMSLNRRKRLVELANEYDVIIIEDSPYREIRFEGEDLPAIKSLDTEGRVIHLGSFSKILCPGMRLGWVVAEKELAEKLCLLKMAADTQSSTLNMHAVNRFMDLYDLDEHIVQLKKMYKHKKDIMLEIIENTFPKNVHYTKPEGGLFTWLTLPKHIDTVWLMKEHVLPEAKVAYVPGSSFFPGEPEHNHCRISYSYMSEEKIIDGMTQLGKILKEHC